MPQAHWAGRMDPELRPICGSAGRPFSFSAHQHSEHWAVPQVHWADSMDPELCPICVETLDATDLATQLCDCSYKVCLWCYQRLCDEDGPAARCPNCRTLYDQDRTKRQALDPKQCAVNSSANLLARQHFCSPWFPGYWLFAAGFVCQLWSCAASMSLRALKKASSLLLQAGRVGASQGQA